LKFVLTMAAAAALISASPCFAQGALGDFDAGLASRSDTQALAFIRIPLGAPEKTRQDPVIGFGVFNDCTQPARRLSPGQETACDNVPIHSLEFTRRLHERDWLLSFTSDKRWVGLARLYPDGFASVREYGPVLPSKQPVPGLDD
jgi:hypothetical protein